MSRQLEVTEMFKEMIEKGYITQPSHFENTEDLPFPGQLPYTPSITTYGTQQMPVMGSVWGHAELEHRS